MEQEKFKDKCIEALSSYLNEKGFNFDVHYVADNWQARLVDEKNELKEKLMKLIDFINSEKFYELSPNNKKVLQNQKIAMEFYLSILNMRVYQDIDNIQVPDMALLGLMTGMFTGGPLGGFPKTEPAKGVDEGK